MNIRNWVLCIANSESIGYSGCSEIDILYIIWPGFPPTVLNTVNTETLIPTPTPHVFAAIFLGTVQPTISGRKRKRAGRRSIHSLSDYRWLAQKSIPYDSRVCLCMCLCVCVCVCDQAIIYVYFLSQLHAMRLDAGETAGLGGEAWKTCKMTTP